MTLRHIESQEGLGKFVNDPNKTKAHLAKAVIEAAEKWREFYPDIPLPSSAIPGVPQPTNTESMVLPRLRTLVVAQRAPEMVKTWERNGFVNFDFFRLSAHQFKEDEDYPGWNVKPGSWFWDNVRNGSISLDARRLEEMLIAIDNTPKPNSDSGTQLYPDDPYGDLLRNLRREGKIKIPKAFEHIPDTSRFGITPELTEHVLPAIAEMLEVDSSRARVTTFMEFNLIGNRSHPEWGKTNTWELMQDKFGDSRRLIGGRSSGGSGLSNVDCVLPSGRNDNVAFRPVIVLYP